MKRRVFLDNKNWEFNWTRSSLKEILKMDFRKKENQPRKNGEQMVNLK